MAAFTLVANQNWEDAAFSTRAGNDSYALAGYQLTINTDSRYCTNSDATKGNIGSFAVSDTLGGSVLIDGTSVRIIPFDTGAGNVPAIGTAITEGGVSAYLLGVWSALNVAPTAAGAAMPASGWIKVKNKTGGNFSAGALGGISANATGADVVGWIEVAAVELGIGTISRLGSFSMTGAWFAVGTTSGASNQQIQMPASLANTYYPGVWIETGVGTGSYEFYPNAGAATTTRTDIGGKVVWISSQGLLTIGNSGAATNGYTPVANCNIRVPNIITINVTAAAMNVNAAPNATVGNRFYLNVYTGGIATINTANICWCGQFSNASSLSLNWVAIADQLYLTGIGSLITMANVGVGLTNTSTSAVNALLMTSCLNGGTFTDCVWLRSTLVPVYASVNLLTGCSGFSFVRNVTRSAALRVGASTGTWTVNYSNTCNWSNSLDIGGEIYLSVSNNLSWTTESYLDSPTGTTGVTVGTWCYYFGGGSSSIKIDGLDFFGLANSNPYTGLFAFYSPGNNNIKIRNIGTAATPLNLGPTNPPSYLAYFYPTVNASLANSSDIEFKRIYTTGATSTLLANIYMNGVIFESVWGTLATTLPILPSNMQLRGVGATWAAAVQTDVLGTHWGDFFLSSSAGRIGLMMNEKTIISPSSTSYTVVASGSGFSFNSKGALITPNVNDEIVWTTPWYILGHKSFATTIPYLSATNVNNHSWFYKVDKNDGNGYGGSWLNLLYRRSGGGTTNLSPTITMTDTTGVVVGDYIYGTNVPADTIIIEVVNGTTCTMSKNATGTGSSYVFTFNHLPCTGFAILTFGAGGYVSAVAGDITKPVVYSGGTPTDSGTLVGFNNTTRQWWVQRTVNTSTFSNTSTAIVITGGTGTGTLSTPATLDAVMDASLGIKLQIRLLTGTAATTNSIYGLYLNSVVDATSVTYQYPLDWQTIIVNSLVTGSWVRITRADTGVVLWTGQEAAGSVSAVISYYGAIIVEVRNAVAASYIPWMAARTIGISSTNTFTALQVLDQQTGGSVLGTVTVNFGVSPRIATVSSPSISISVLDLFATLRSIEASSTGIFYPSLVGAAGKDSLGGGLYVGITATLKNALLAFAARSGPSWVTCSVSGGNLVALDSGGSPVSTPISSTAYVNVNYTASVSAALLYYSQIVNDLVVLMGRV